MLVLSRREAEKVLFPALGITVEVTRVQGKTVRLGIDAPDEIRIVRGELNQFEPTTFRSEQPDPQSSPFPPREVQGCLDAANLAIRLAMNQLNQQLTAQAGLALENALHCLEELELAVVQHAENPSASQTWEPETASVREAGTKYRVATKPTVPAAAVVAEESEVRQRLTNLLTDRGFRVVEFAQSDSLFDYLRMIEQPAVVLTVESAKPLASTDSVSEEAAGSKMVEDVKVAKAISSDSDSKQNIGTDCELRISGVSSLRRNRLSFSLDRLPNSSGVESESHPTQITGWFDDSEIAAEFESMLRCAV